MAAIHRPTEATYAVHERLIVDTTDREDHTFCGILFPVQCKEILPVSHVVIHSIAVRGKLGPLTVWVTNNDKDMAVTHNNNNNNMAQISLKAKHWTKVYEKIHGPSFCEYRALTLEYPIALLPGQVRGIYVHSTRNGDESIVYDNRQKTTTYNDDYITVLPGRAHLSPTVFGSTPIWGWGNAWRDNREFVGRISYGVVYTLWNPHHYWNFGSHFQHMVTTLFLCQRNYNSPISRLPDDVLFYILNMCKWDWAHDSSSTLKQEKLRQHQRLPPPDITTPKRRVLQQHRLVMVPQVCSQRTEEERARQETHMAHHPFFEQQNDTATEEEDTEEDEDDDGYEHHGANSTFSFLKLNDFAESEEEDTSSRRRVVIRSGGLGSFLRSQLGRIRELRITQQQHVAIINDTNVTDDDDIDHNHNDDTEDDSVE